MRTIDAFVDTLDLQTRGFKHAKASSTDQPSLDPALLLKLLLYGYENQIKSSRQLEAETRRNIEVMWLCQNASPSYKTIANFRKNNAAAVHAANLEFVLLYREPSPLGGSEVAIDRTYLKTDAKSFPTKAKLERDLIRAEKSMAAYCRKMDEENAKEEEEGPNFMDDPELVAKMIAFFEEPGNREALQKSLREGIKNQVSEG